PRERSLAALSGRPLLRPEEPRGDWPVLGRGDARPPRAAGAGAERAAGAPRHVQRRGCLAERRRALHVRPLRAPLDVGVAVEQQPRRLLGMRLLEGFAAAEAVDPEIDAGVESTLSLARDLGVAGREAAA